MLPAAPEQAPPSRPERAARPGPDGKGRRRAPSGLFEPVQLVRSFPEALRKLHPRTLVRNPVLFVVSVGAVLTTLSALLHPAVFTWVISLWLWLTVVFANLAEAVAEGRGKAQAESLRRARTDTVALRLLDWRYGTDPRTARTEAVAATALKMCIRDRVDGVAAVDESAVTGESAPVIRESGGDRSGVTGGTTVLSDRIVVRVGARPGHSFLDAPALAQADVGVAMNTGTSAAKEAGNMVDLDSNPTKLLEIVEIGKQLLITRGALTTFSITNDVAKYFAIIPAMFAGSYPGLESLNIMGLHSPTSAITSAIIFNALIIVALIPLALRGVRYTPSSAHDLLRRNLLVYGLGGLVLPFVGIKLIDLLIAQVPGLG